jgi:hypothetical protein
VLSSGCGAPSSTKFRSVSSIVGTTEHPRMLSEGSFAFTVVDYNMIETRNEGAFTGHALYDISNIISDCIILKKLIFRTQLDLIIA